MVQFSPMTIQVDFYQTTDLPVALLVSSYNTYDTKNDDVTNLLWKSDHGLYKS